MSSKISELTEAAALGGAEQLPGVQTGGNVRLTPLQLANFLVTVPEGMNSFRTVKFGQCELDPNNNETMNLRTPSTDSVAMALNVSDGDGGYIYLGHWGARLSTGLFFCSGDDAQPVGFENVGGVMINEAMVLDAVGNVVDDGGLVLLNRAVGQQASIANATGAGDVVAQLNALLSAMRTLGLIATS